MRILSLSHDPLPDVRVEKTARSAEKNGHSNFFAGPQIRGFAFSPKTYQKTYSLPFNRRANLKIPPYWNSLKRKLKKVVSDCKPDLIHAHNIIAGKLASELGTPFVYDDHEYWSVSMKAAERTKSYHVLTQFYKRWLMNGWENEVLKRASAAITTAETVAEEFRKHNSAVFVVPNFPSLEESQGIRINKTEGKHLSCVYVGADCTQQRPSPERNVTGCIDIFKRNEVGTLTVVGDDKLPSESNIVSLGFLPHQEMMSELTRHHIGLLPWKKHWLHKYKHPNKPYEYAHAGLLTIAASDMVNVVSNLREYVKTFEDYNDLLELLMYYNSDIEGLCKLKSKIREYALDNLVWEKNETEILEAYSKC